MFDPSNLQRLASIAVDQWGLVTRQQLENAGIPPATLDRITSDSSVLERVATGVYRHVVAPIPEHIELLAAWLQLAPEIHAWQRRLEHGVVSHRSAAMLLNVGDLPADRHEFTLPNRKQTRRPDVRLHIRRIDETDVTRIHGVFVTRAPRTAADLLRDNESPESVARVVSEAIGRLGANPAHFRREFERSASKFGFRRGDGLSVLRWLLELSGAVGKSEWMELARSARVPA